MSLLDFYDNRIKPTYDHLGVLLDENQKQFRLTSTKQIRVIDQSHDSILVEVLSGDDLYTPEERAANYYAHDNHEDEEYEDY